MRNELVFKNHENGYKVAKILLDEGNVVMLSYEEEFLILNWEFSEHGADRNDVVFMQRDEYEEEFDKQFDAIIADLRHDGRLIEFD